MFFGEENGTATEEEDDEDRKDNRRQLQPPRLEEYGEVANSNKERNLPTPREPHWGSSSPHAGRVVGSVSLGRRGVLTSNERRRKGGGQWKFT